MLAEPLRARIVDALAEAPACVCHLVEITGAKQPTVSHHLRALRQAGLVAAEPDGRFTYYRLVPDPFERTGRRLTDLAAQARAGGHRRRDC
jgi:ArsR family transcriptional regulator, arsenate/arsenite/antimonite-responsive transcriptional repressor